MAEKRSTYTRLHNWYAEALAKKEGLPPAMRVHLLLMRLTFGFHTKEKPISLGDICAKTGMAKMSVQRSLKKLKELGLIELKDQKTGKRTISLVTDRRHFNLQDRIQTEQAIEVPKGNKMLPPPTGGNKTDTGGQQKRYEKGNKMLPVGGNKNDPLLLVKEKDLKEKKKLLKKEIPPWVDMEQFSAFREWRQSIGKPITEKNLFSFFSELERITGGMWWRQGEVYDRCMARGWAMLIEPLERHHDPMMNYPPEERSNVKPT